MISIFTHILYLILNVWVFCTKQFSSPLWTATRCPTNQFNFDTNYPKLVQPHRLRAQLHKIACLISDVLNQKQWVSRLLRLLSDLATNWEFLGSSP